MADGGRLRRADIPESLSMCELECLLWTAEGKTAEEVASILGISVFTVNRYVSVGVRKLNCVNKHHAAIRALRAGLICSAPEGGGPPPPGRSPWRVGRGFGPKHAVWCKKRQTLAIVPEPPPRVAFRVEADRPRMQIGACVGRVIGEPTH